MTKYRSVLFFLIFIFMINFISAVPPFSPQAFSEGYDIKIPMDNVIKINNDYEFAFHVYNISNGMPVTDAGCYLHLYDSTGGHLFDGYTTVTGHIFDYEFEIDAGNFTTATTYYYNIQCNTSALGGYHSAPLFVNNSGTLSSSDSSIIFLIGILIIIFFAYFFLKIGNKTEHSAFKMIYVGISGIFIFVAVLFFAVIVEQSASPFTAIIEGFAVFVLIIKILASMFVIGLVVFILVIAYNSWLNKRGLK